jgi:hypothetical protein
VTAKRLTAASGSLIWREVSQVSGSHKLPDISSGPMSMILKVKNADKFLLREMCLATRNENMEMIPRGGSNYFITFA